MEHTFPASRVLALVELAGRFSVKPQTLLGPFGLDEDRLSEPEARVSLATYVAVTERARELTGEPAIGIYLGLSRHTAGYGFVGFAATSAPTLGEALRLAVEFAPAITSSASLSLSVQGDTAAFILRQHADLGSIRDVALLGFFVGLLHMTREVMGLEPAAVIELSIPGPAYFARFAAQLPDIRFDQPVDQLLFPSAALELKLPRSDRAALKLAKQQCEAQLAQLGLDGSLLGQVRRALTTLPVTNSGQGFAGMEQVAKALHVSGRTLKRRLAEHGVSFSDLLQQERKLRALHLLRGSELSIDQIAEVLGYSSGSNFTRAFVRWTGKTPVAHRQALPAAGILLGEGMTFA